MFDLQCGTLNARFGGTARLQSGSLESNLAVLIIGCSVLLGDPGRGKCVLQVDCRHQCNIIITLCRFLEVIVGKIILYLYRGKTL